jgi:hypothetical protein
MDSITFHNMSVTLITWWPTSDGPTCEGVHVVIPGQVLKENKPQCRADLNAVDTHTVTSTPGSGLKKTSIYVAAVKAVEDIRIKHIG